MEMPGAIPAGSVIITPTELYREMLATHKAVTDMHSVVQQVATVVPDHESRLRSLERRLWVATGAAGALAAGVAEVIRAATGG